MEIDVVDAELKHIVWLVDRIKEEYGSKIDQKKLKRDVYVSYRRAVMAEAVMVNGMIGAVVLIVDGNSGLRVDYVYIRKDYRKSAVLYRLGRRCLQKFRGRGKMEFTRLFEEMELGNIRENWLEV